MNNSGVTTILAIVAILGLVLGGIWYVSTQRTSNGAEIEFSVPGELMGDGQ